MQFNKHSNLKGLHAFMGASKYHWINYDEEKMISYFKNFRAAQRGTELHDFAHSAIVLGQNLPKNTKTLNAFVNDAIGYRMESEQVLYYSDNCFGTADAISFRKNLLRIHDLKTGETPAHMEQLVIYAALFCLEYGYKPMDISIELRIYQSNEVITYEPSAEEVQDVMDKIVEFDKLLRKLKIEEEM